MSALILRLRHHIFSLIDLKLGVRVAYQVSGTRLLHETMLLKGGIDASAVYDYPRNLNERYR